MRLAITAAVAALLTNLASAAYTLVANTPTRGYASSTGHAYFRFPFKSSDNANVVISVTATAGDPDLFVDCVPSPTAGAPFRRTELGNDTISLTPAQLTGQGCTNGYVYIMVQGAGEIPGQRASVSFVIVAGLATSKFAVNISPGFPGSVASAQNSIGYAMFTAPATAPVGTLAFTMSVARGGGAEMYVMQNAKAQSLTWPIERCLNYSGSTGLCKNSEVLPNTFTLSTTTPGQSPDQVIFPSYAANQVYIVGVVSSAGDALQATISVSVGSSETQLELGQSEIVSIAPGSYARYYSIIVPVLGSSKPDIVINAYALSGSAVAYASTTANPTNVTNTWVPTPGAADSQVNIPYSSLVSKCVGFTVGSNCTIHIAVQGKQAFNLVQVYVAYSNSPNYPEDLPMGGSVNLDLNPRTYGYVLSALNIPKGQPAWTVTTEIISGSANVYIVVGTNRRFYPSTSPDAHPSSSSGIAIARFEPEPTMEDQEDAAVAALANHRCLKHRAAAESTAQAPGASFRGTADQLSRAKKYAGSLLAMPAASAGPCPDDSVVSDLPSAVIPGVYCSNCEVRITVFSGSFGAQATVTLTVDDVVELTPLADGIPSAGVVGYGSYDYYSFEVEMSSPKPVHLQLSSLSGGDADVYVKVQNPAEPNLMPSTSSYTWRSVATGSDFIDIAVTDSHYVSNGTYILAVFGAKFRSDSEYSITALVDSALTVYPLPVDEATAVSISPGAYHFFSFTPCASSPGKSGCGSDAAPIVKFQWTLQRGSCNVFITNEYHPGSSSPTMLPMSGNNRLTTLWSITNGSTNAFIGPGVPKYDPSAKVYTIGILAASPYSVALSIVGTFEGGQINIVQLTPGVPMGPFTVGSASNTFFAVDYADAALNTDVFFSAETEYGTADIVVAPPQIPNGEAQDWAPRCQKQSIFGAPPTCLGYVYKSSSSPPEVGIAHLAPCFPYVGKANSNCSTGLFHQGRWLATVYSRVASKFSVLAQFGDSHITLEEGVTASASTQLTTICSNRGRTTGTCPIGSGSTAFAAWLTTQVPLPNPNSGALEDAQMVIDRQCNLGGCRKPLEIFMTSCYPDNTAPAGYLNCDNQIAFPSAEYNQQVIRIAKQSGSVNIPADFICGKPMSWNDDALPASNDDNQAYEQPGFSTSNCVIYFGVFSGRSKTSPGFFEEFGVTFTASNDNSITIVPEDQTLPGVTWDGGVEELTTDSLSKFYDVYFNTTLNPSVRVSVHACAGVPTVYACWPGSTGCTNTLKPSAGNSAQVATYSPSRFATVMTFTSLPSFEINLGVTVDAQSSTSPSFRMTVTSGSGPILNGPTDLAAAFNSQGTLEIQWGQGTIYRLGQMLSPVTVRPIVYVFTTSAIPADAVLGADCGVLIAYNQLVADASQQSSPSVQRFTLPYAQTELDVSGLDQTQSYTVALRSECSGSCLPKGQPTMFAASSPVQAQPYSPGPVPSTVPPTPAPSPTPTPKDGGMGGGAVAGIVVASLAAVAVAGGFWWYRRGAGGSPGDEMGYYAAAD